MVEVEGVLLAIRNALIESLPREIARKHNKRDTMVHLTAPNHESIFLRRLVPSAIRSLPAISLVVSQTRRDEGSSGGANFNDQWHSMIATVTDEDCSDELISRRMMRWADVLDDCIRDQSFPVPVQFEAGGEVYDTAIKIFVPQIDWSPVYSLPRAQERFRQDVALTLNVHHQLPITG